MTSSRASLRNAGFETELNELNELNLAIELAIEFTIEFKKEKKEKKSLAIEFTKKIKEIR